MSEIKSVSVFCIWRDSEETIQRTLSQLEDLESLEGFKFSYFFYENDSTDKTVEILKSWLETRSGKLESEQLNAEKFGSVTDPRRMKFLCSCRNKCKNLAEENKSDYSLLVDSDIIFNKENLIIHLNDIKNLEDAVMITPNVRQNIKDLTFNLTEDSYYDIYCFRDRYGTQGVYFSDCPSFQRDDHFYWKIKKPIITMSSFGGFALIKSDIFNKVNWTADIHCDHVNMCYDISRYGKIYCDPRSLVYVNIDLNKINLDVCANIGKQQKQKYDAFF